MSKIHPEDFDPDCSVAAYAILVREEPDEDEDEDDDDEGDDENEDGDEGYSE